MTEIEQSLQETNPAETIEIVETIETPVICIAIKTNKEKCTQNAKEGEMLCNRHYNLKQKKGEILTINNIESGDNLQLVINGDKYCCEVKDKKKRGRRRKYEISDKFYNNEFITVWPEIIDGMKLLVDNEDNVYTFDMENPEYLGVKTLECKIKRVNVNTKHSKTMTK